MRHIKKFEAHSSSWEYEQEIKDNLMDICLELKDQGYVIMVDKDVPISTLHIYKMDGPPKLGKKRIPFYYADVKEEIERVKEYLGDKFINTYVIIDVNSNWVLVDKDFLLHVFLHPKNMYTGIKIEFRM